MVNVTFVSEESVIVSAYYKTPSATGEFVFQSLQDFSGYSSTELNPARTFQITGAAGENIYLCKSTLVSSSIVEITEQERDGTPTVTTVSVNDFINNYEGLLVITGGTYTTNILSSGVCQILYEYTAPNLSKESYYGRIAFVDNRLPLKKWTVTDVLNRCFDLIIPLKTTATETITNNIKELSGISSELPLFILNGVNDYNADGSVNTTTYTVGSTAWKLEKILAPEFSFTKMNLREQLKQVGGFIHGEPRIIGKNERNQYIVDFDWYGGEEYATMNPKRCISTKLSHDVNNFATSLDSETDNLISQLNWAQGVITEPFTNGARSLRTERVNARISDNSTSGFIATDFPIYAVGERKQVLVMNIPNYSNPTNDGKGWDITPYVFESADYNNLSSYDGIYPYSKAYAIYYTQGEKNIQGLFFKAPDAVSPVFQNYAIVNILREVTGDSNLDINEVDYPKLTFNVTYLPIYSARVKTNKALILNNKPFTLAYNQSANIIESNYYGENLKGAIARLGNVDKQKTYKVAFLTDIPKTGQKIKEEDGDYYISAVSVEMMSYYFKVTIGLTKKFNRISQHVGINLNKRMWEVSEKMAQNRSRTLTEFILFSTNEQQNSQSVFFEKGDEIFRVLLNQPNSYDENGYNEYTYGTIDSVLCTQFSKNGKPTQSRIALPVLTTALGNSMLFTFKMEDNYSAGQQAVYVQNNSNNNVSGYWGNYVPYCDYYGRYYYWNTEFFFDGYSDASDPFALPKATLDATHQTWSGSHRVIKTLTKYRKDSREIPSDAYELSVVTDNPDIVIGSALCSNNRLVNRNPDEIVCVGLSKKLNFLDKKIGQDLIVQTLDYTIDGNTLSVVVPNGVESWAFLTVSEVQEIQVEDEDGNQITQSVELGGELVFGQNVESAGTKTIYCAIKDKVYEF